MRAAKIVQLETTTILNTDGEISKKEDSRVLQFPSEPPFFKTYAEDITLLMGLPVGIKAVLSGLLAKMDYENIITLSTRAKKEIAEKSNITVGTLDNYLVSLTKAAILKRIGRSEYEVNPNYFARGQWVETIKKRQNWELVITYDSKTGERISIEGKSAQSKK